MIFQRTVTTVWLAAMLGRSMAAQATGPRESFLPPQPSTQPATQPRDFRPEPGRFGDGGFRRPRFLAPLSQDRPTVQQISDAEKFVSGHSPNHFRVYQRTEHAPEFHDRMQFFMVRGYLDLQILNNDDPELYKMKVDQVEIQDKIFGIAVLSRDLQSEGDRLKLREQIRPLERELLAKRKEEAVHRLDRMKQAVESEKQKIASLDTMATTGIEEQINQEIESSGRMIPPFGGPNRGGPGPGRGR